MSEESQPTPSEPIVEPPNQAAGNLEPPLTTLQQALIKRMHNARRFLFWTGLGFTIAGIVALMAPVASSLATVVMIAWLLVFAGVVGVIGSFSFHGVGPFFGALLTGLLTIAVGVFMLKNPDMALKFLTLFVAIVFLVDGAFTAGTAFELKPASGWGWVLFSAVASILAGILIISGLPGTSLVVLGILVGVRFLSGGISTIMVSKLLPKA